MRKTPDMALRSLEALSEIEARSLDPSTCAEVGCESRMEVA